ncbi:hypothetical protein LGM75_24650 [Burkholderia multivorans]|uniref:hypothetical protein n=1 Tax=Burkholderia multivorans TaxID=87883 RepID=UPI0012DE507E|nr:hypothetical protein [Burkholderia multivorans]EKS9914876.1 hypothetical protein [Burkholderia multivorans]MBU9468611.1 hypothetical protein [Burkholderia multivorans]MBU9661839.1 hypothetical protein [Burkholderia multivorans]MCA8129547.1 hypothetical protein [Burkholderia multivorans]MDR8750731.1 hypothetical protein [Burkholderia multivorans]
MKITDDMLTENKVEIVKATSWLVIQPNGRSYVVTDPKKALIARDCGYTVQAIVEEKHHG